jgi:tRNA A-37 threonylcarbamoyl transferase component Bud32
MSLILEWFPGFEGPPGEAGWALLLGPGDAVLVSRSRTTRTESGVLALPAGPVPVHRKVYSYPGLGSILKGAFRTTFAAPSRARREADALRRLGALGLAPPPVAIAERRTGSVLREAILAVRTVEGGLPLPDAPPDPDLAAAAGRAAGRIHAAGLAHLSLAPRNLVAARGPAGWTVAKVDTGRMREAGPGDPARIADLADLVAGMEGRWSGAALDALRAGYAEEAGAWPAEVDAALPAARERLGRRRPRG